MAKSGHDNHGGHGHGDEHGPGFLHHHFDTPQQQFDSDKLGMWLFLVTEILMFGGLFCAYSIYRATHPEIFIYAHQFLDKTLGGINTIVLITSSMTMAWAVRAAQLNQIKLMRVLLVLTLLGGFGFMGIKYVEYTHKIHEGLLWGSMYKDEAAREAAHGDHSAEEGHSAEVSHADETEGHDGGMADGTAAEGATDSEHAAAAAPAEGATGVDADVAQGDLLFPGQEPTKVGLAAQGPAGLARMPDEPDTQQGSHEVMAEPRNVRTFFAVYFMMTGLHGLHVLAGMIAISCLIIISFTGRLRIGIGSWSLVNVTSGIDSDYYTPVDLVGLFWHLVDLIWIFLFPLLYLIH